MKRTFGLWIIALLVLSTAALALPTWNEPFATSGITATATAGTTSQFTATHTGADNGVVTVSLAGAPSFVTASTNGATATFVVDNTAVQGTYPFTTTVQDSNSTNTTSVTLTVNPAPLETLVVPGAVTAGGVSSRASNPLADDTEDQIFRTSVTLPLSNNGSAPITGLSASSVAAAGFNANDLNISIKNVPTTLNNGVAAVTATIELNIPGNLDSVDAAKLKEQGFKIADIVFSGTSNGQPVTATTTLNAQRENQLEIKNVRVCVNDKCTNADDGDDVKNIKPGDDMSIEIEVENKYSDNDREDLDIENVEVEFDIDDDDFDENDNEDLGDIGADDEASETFTFEVEDDTKDGTYDLVVRTFGRDENGALHGQEITIDLEVERENHEIELRGVSLSPSTLSCGKDTARVSLNFANIGKRDEDEVAIEVAVDELGIVERIGLFELDEDDTESQSLSLVLPEDAEKKDYTVVVKSFYDTSIQSDEEVLTLTVAECTTGDDSSTVVTVPTTTVGSGSTTTATQTTPVVARRTPSTATSAGSSTDTEESFTDSPWYVALLALVAVVLVAVLIVLAVKVLGRSSDEL